MKSREGWTNISFHFKRDLEESRLSRQEAAELLGCLRVKLADMVSAEEIEEKFREMAQKYYG